MPVNITKSYGSRKSSSDISSEYPYLNNFDLNSYSTVWYVDAVNGNNSNIGTSPDQAFQTYATAYNSSADGDAVIVFPGNYDATGLPQPDASFVNPTFLARTNQTVIAARPGTVIFSNLVGGLRDSPMMMGAGVGIGQSVYGFVFRHVFKDNSANYTKSVFRWAEYSLYNCAYFIGNNFQEGPSVNYNNGNSLQPKTFNCTFSLYRQGTQESWVGSYSGLPLDATDTAFINNIDSNRTDILGNTTTLPNTNYDTSNVDFDFTDNADINAGVGVYTGTYAWPQKPSTY